VWRACSQRGEDGEKLGDVGEYFGEVGERCAPRGEVGEKLGEWTEVAKETVAGWGESIKETIGIGQAKTEAGKDAVSHKIQEKSSDIKGDIHRGQRDTQWEKAKDSDLPIGERASSLGEAAKQESYALKEDIKSTGHKAGYEANKEQFKH